MHVFILSDVSQVEHHALAVVEVNLIFVQSQKLLLVLLLLIIISLLFIFFDECTFIFCNV